MAPSGSAAAGSTRRRARCRSVFRAHLSALFLERWRLSVLHMFLPMALYLQYHSHGHELALFCCSLLACVPLAERLGFATEQLAMHVGDVAAGLINVTFGNAPELIVSYIALGQRAPTIVQDSLLGSTLSNLLLVLGTASLRESDGMTRCNAANGFMS